jgi:hypothetical protein
VGAASPSCEACTVISSCIFALLLMFGYLSIVAHPERSRESHY